MNCLEAQSYIMPFIDGKIPENKQEEFVLHMKNCKKCHEELEIYYTLIVGMKQLDNNKELSTDFNRDLENGLNKLQNRVKGRRRIKFSTFSIVCIGIISFLVLFYGQCLNKVYAYEQNTKFNSQGKYFFYSELHYDIYINLEDRILESEYNNKPDSQTLYEEIELYNEIKETNNILLDIGGEKIK